MSRRLFAFLVSELKTLRLVCQNPACGNVVELTPERLASGPCAAWDSLQPFVVAVWSP